MKKNLANIITGSRILGTLVLIFLPVLSVPYLIIHTLTGATDAIDGYVARKTNSVSSFGSKLDTASDLLFYTVMMLKLWDILQANLPRYVWVLIYIILTLRAIYYLLVAFKYKTLSSRHSVLNKIAGLLMFALVYVVKSKYLLYYSLLILVITYTSLIQETIYLIKNK